MQVRRRAALRAKKIDIEHGRVFCIFAYWTPRLDTAIELGTPYSAPIARIYQSKSVKPEHPVISKMDGVLLYRNRNAVKKF